MKIPRGDTGFALPTVVITSLVLVMLLMAALSTATSTRVALDESYQDQISREAAEAGLEYAKICYYQVSKTATASQWPNAGTLDTGDDCYGAVLPGENCGTATATAACYVMNDTNIRTSFSISPASVGTSPSLISFGSTGTVQLSRPTGVVYKAVTSNIKRNFSIDLVGLASGNDTVCAIMGGKLYCWGKNDFGQVGNGGTADVASPYLVQGALAGKYVQAVATGMSHTCAIAGDTPALTSMVNIYCWGANAAGSQQYGLAMTASKVPVKVYTFTATENLNGLEISARDHTCVRAVSAADSTDLREYCWGENGNKQAGENDSGSAPDPKPFSGWTRIRDSSGTRLGSVLQINSVNSGSSCGVNDAVNRYAFCLGNGDYGALGNGTSGTGNDTMRAVWVLMYNTSTKLGKTVKVVTNNGRVCALSYYTTPTTYGTNRAVWCWGSNMNYGVGTTPDWRLDSGTVFSAVTIRTKATRVHSDTLSGTCLYDATVAGGTTNCAAIAAAGRPATNIYNADISDIAIADWNMCLLIKGIVYCSGYNAYGQLGQGHTLGPDGNPAVPIGTATAASQVLSGDAAVPVLGALKGKTTVAIEGGNNHFCARTDELLVYCWGANGSGQLGDGTFINRPSPVRSGTPIEALF